MQEGKTQKRQFSWRRRLALLTGILVSLVLIASIASALVNHFSPRASKTLEVLAPQEKALLAEALQLKKTFGDSLWPGYSQADIPVLLFNERYSFLVGMAPPTGWQPVSDDSYFGSPYYRSQIKVEAFTVQLGDRWAGSMATREWMRISLGQQLRNEMPGPIKPVFPYPLAVHFLAGRDAEKYVSTILHECFHAYQAETAPERFAVARAAYRNQSSYPLQRDGMKRGWDAELKLLASALQAKADDEAADFSRQFIAQRHQRRRQAGLSEHHIDYERQIEWLEGLAKYAELGAWEQAFLAQQKGYKSSAGITADPEFRHYTTFPKRWAGEVSTLKLQASKSGDIRFYYSGMAQAFLLDRLAPGWKTSVSLDAFSLEELLEQAVTNRQT